MGLYKLNPKLSCPIHNGTLKFVSEQWVTLAKVTFKSLFEESLQIGQTGEGLEVGEKIWRLNYKN